MSVFIRSLTVTIILGLAACALLSSCPAYAASKSQIDRDADAALQQLFASTPAARMLAREAKAILVFPSIVKAGFVVGVQGGNGALRKKGRTVGYYNTASGSYGLQGSKITRIYPD